MKWSWLQNPAVALIELLASAIAVVQSVAWLCRLIYRLQTEAENERYRRLRIAAALAALAVVIVTSAITWPVIMAEAAKGGDHGFVGVMYPLEFAFLGVFGALTLLREARARQHFSPSACWVLAVTLAIVAIAYFFSSGPVGWIGAGATWSVPSLGMVAWLYMYVQHVRQVRPEQTREH
jgi:hypothetical protein